MRLIEKKFPSIATTHRVGHPGYEFAPKVGTYWQDRNRPARFFMVVSTHEHEGYSRVRMLRVDGGCGGEHEWMFTTVSAWNDLFAPTTASGVLGSPYAATASVVFAEPNGVTCVRFGGGASIRAADLTDEQVDQLADEHGEQYPGMREFLQGERERQQAGRKSSVPPEDAERFVGEYRKRFPNIAEHFREAVADARRKLWDAEIALGVATVKKLEALSERRKPRNAEVALGEATVEKIEALNEHHRDVAEYFRESAAGAPPDDERPPTPGSRYRSLLSGQGYTVIDVRLKPRSAERYVTMKRNSDGFRIKFTYRDQVTWQAAWCLLDEEHAEAALGAAALKKCEALNVRFRVFAELDKRAPGWRNRSSAGPVVSEAELAIRAIRRLHRDPAKYRVKE